MKSYLNIRNIVTVAVVVLVAGWFVARQIGGRSKTVAAATETAAVAPVRHSSRRPARVPAGPPRCGDGMVNQLDEECEPPGTPFCDDKCRKQNTACVACEKKECDPVMVGCEALGTGEERMLCNNVLACIRSTKCAKGDTIEPCFCGSAKLEDCLTGVADGPCFDEMEAAARPTSSDPSDRAVEIATRWVNPKYPIGRAVSLAQCDGSTCKDNCAL
jgi:hypothetical protein